MLGVGALLWGDLYVGGAGWGVGARCGVGGGEVLAVYRARHKVAQKVSHTES